MNKVGGGGLLVAGIFLIILGGLVQLDFIVNVIDAILQILGVVLIAVGAGLGIWGIVKMVSGGSTSGASDY